MPSQDLSTTRTMAPPRGTWSMLATHDGRHVVLPLDGHRSIFAPWPPQHPCEDCGDIRPAGYVGPASLDRVYFPSDLLRCVCEACARRWLGLGPEELTGHVCEERCTDRLHLEVVDGSAAAGLAVGADDHPVAAGFRSRGWRIAEVGPEGGPSGAAVAVWIEPVRPLPW